MQVGGVPVGVLGEQQADMAGLLLEVVDAEMIEGVERLMTQEQGICPLAGGADIDNVMLEGLEVIQDEKLLLLIMIELLWGDFIKVLLDVRSLESVEK